MRSILVDARPLVAPIDRDDAHHAEMRGLLRDTAGRPTTTRPVVARLGGGLGVPDAAWWWRGQPHLDALRYLRTKHPAGAATVQRRAEAVIELLREHPAAGHAGPEFPDLPHRELPVPPYCLFHRVAGDTVWIAAVWHARQLPESPEGGSKG